MNMLTVIRWTARILGTAILALVVAIVNHGVPLNVVFGPVLVTGLLYLGCWWISNGGCLSPRSRPGPLP